MSLTGKNALSIRKKEVKEQKTLALGVKKIVFAHKATAGETGIDVSSLVIPTEMSSNGFTNANVADILAANMFFYRKNVTVVSSAKNELIQDLSYSIRSSSRINFLGFTAEEGEIFTVTIDQSAKTSLTAVDATPISATGTIAAGLTDFNVGTPFQVNAFPNSQAGAVTVYVDGVQQFRNTNNQAAPADGNYYEVDPGGGFGTLIRLNTTSLVDRDILVKSNGFAEKPDISQMAEIEKVQGQIDAMVPDLAAATGNPETNYQAAPNNVDLKVFGDRLLQAEQDILAKEDEFDIDYQIKTQQADATGTGTMNDLTFNNLEIGKKYRFTGQFSHRSNSTGGASNVSVTHNSVVIGASQYDAAGNDSNGRMRTGISGVFTATATVLTFELTAASANDFIEGDGTRFQTYVQLEELPQHVATSKWS